MILWVTLSPQQPTDGGFVRDALAWWAERGLPAWVTYDTVEVAANVILFVPFGFLLSRSLSKRPPRGSLSEHPPRGSLSERPPRGSLSERPPRGSLSERSESKGLLPLLCPTILGLALSLTIEFTQSAFLPARFATVSDLIANTAGALLGASLAVTTVRRRAVRRQVYGASRR